MVTTEAKEQNLSDLDLPLADWHSLLRAPGLACAPTFYVEAVGRSARSPTPRAPREQTAELIGDKPLVRVFVRLRKWFRDCASVVLTENPRPSSSCSDLTG
jgi:hypothetical protein